MSNPVNFTAQDVSCDSNANDFAMKVFLSARSFINLVIVEAVDEDAKTVDVKKLVYGITADGKKIENGLICNIPYLQSQSGSRAIIIPPSVGDLGLIGTCDQDISNALSSKKGALQGSARRNSLSDSVYLMGVASINKEPSEYIELVDKNINLVTPSGEVNINGLKIGANGKLTLVDGSVVDAHTHGGVEQGSSDTSPLAP